MLCVRATATPTGWTQQHLETSEHAFYKSFRCSCHFVSTSIRSINPWSNNQRASCPAAQQEIPQYFKLLQYSSTQVPPAPTVSSVDWSHLHCFNQILMFDCKHEGFSKLRPLLINVHIIMWGSSNRWIGDQVIDETRRQKSTLIFYCGENVAVYSLQTATAATALPPGRVWRDRCDVLWNTRGRNNHMIRRSSTLSHECRAELKDMSPFRLSIKLRFKLCQSDRCTNKVNSNPPSRLKLPTLTEKTNLLTWEQRRCSPTGR